MSTRPAGALLLAVAVALPGAARAAEPDLPPLPDAVVRSVLDLRAAFPGAAPTLSDSWVEIVYRGRPSLEIKGRTAAQGGEPALRDIAILDLATERVTSFVWFPGASRRKAGEPILPMSEASVAADALTRRLFPGVPLTLDGIARYRASGEESVYYEVSYSPEGEVRYLEPPVRMLLDASSSSLFRLDVDAGWLDAPPPAARRVSAKAAQVIAGVRLSPPALERAFGPGARATRLTTEGMYFVRSNGWPTEDATSSPAGTGRYAWGVSFTVAGAASGGEGTLFVDAATGRALGGLPGPPP